MPEEATESIPSSEFNEAHSRSEHQEQCHVIEWATARASEVPEYKLLHSIPNGGARNAVVGAKMKAEGVKKGVPDLCLPVTCEPYAGLYIEMKRADGGRVRESQKWWIKRLREQGYCVMVCHGADEAVRVIRDYLERNND